MKILIRTGSGHWEPVDAVKGPEIDLQKLLVKSPEILPAEDLEVSFVAAVPEVKLGSGYADIVAFSTNGEIAIIECKRADSSDAKRKVIGQILEYASHLWRMSYEELDSRVKEVNWNVFHKNPREVEGKSLVELLKDVAKEAWDEENFRNGIRDSVEKGEFLLIIAVDEINDELKRAVQYLSECGTPAYSLYALEMRRFKHGDTEVLIPHIHPESRVLPPPTVWNWEKFLRTIKENLQPEVVAVIEQLYNWAKNEELIKVDFGKQMLFYPKGFSRSIVSVSTSGVLYLNYGSFFKMLDENILREFHTKHGLNVPDDFSKFPPVKLADAFVDKPEAVEKFKDAVIWLTKGTQKLRTNETRTKT